MAKIHILHLSDLHYSKTKGKDYDQGQILNALNEDIIALKKEGQEIDLIIFSGDLVFSGDDTTDFQAAFDEFIKPLLANAGVNLDRFYIVPGNHDISRKAISDYAYIEEGLKRTLQSTQALNDFIGKHYQADSDQVPFARVKNYEEFVRNLNKPVLNTPFVKTFKLKKDGITVGIACFNTAWRATGEGGSAEKGNILIGERAVDMAVKNLTDCDIRFAVFHHPLSWLNDFDADTIRYRLEKNFAGIFCGHTHVSLPKVELSETGASFTSQCGCLYQGRKERNGYQLVSFNLDENSVTALVREYDDKYLKFYPSHEGSTGIHFHLKKLSTATETSLTDDFIIRARELVREKTMKHIVMIDEHAPTTINEAFICPPISTKSEKEAYASGAQEKDTFLDVNAILESDGNTAVYGRREGGKTSFAYYLALKCTEGLHDQKHIIPIVIDFKKLSKSKYKFMQLAASFYEDHPNAKKIDEYINKNQVLIILDNAVCSSKEHTQLLKDVISNFPDNKWVLLLDEELPGEESMPLPEVIGNLKKFYLHSLKRKQIRKFTDQWSERFQLPTVNTFNSVMNYIDNGDLPRTGYIVSLLLWAISKKKEAERVNEAVLIENIVEMLLGKADFRQALRAELDYINKAFVLRKVAVLLKSKGGYANSNDIVQIIIDVFKERALDYDASDLYSGFIRCGILKKEIDSSISFKYSAFQDYFVAKEIEHDKELYEEILQNEKFLDYSREIELFTGINRENTEFLLKLREMVEKTLPDIVAKQKIENFAQDAIDSDEMEKAVNELTALTKKKISFEDIDDAVDMAEKRFADDRKDSKESIPGFAQYLTLYGKTIRNLELNKETDKIEHVKFFYICWVQLSMAFGEMIRESIAEWKTQKDEKVTRPDALKLSNYVANTFMPIMLSFIASEQVGTRKLDSVLKTLARDESLSLGISTFSLFTLLDHKGKDWQPEWKTFLSKRANPQISRLCIEKLIAHLSVTPMSNDEQSKFKQLIVNTGTGNKMFPASAKGQVYQHLDGVGKKEE